MAFLDQVAEMHGEDAFGYCTNFMVFGSDIDFERARAEIAAMGSSAVIVGDESVLKVHIHTENPGLLLDYALALGRARPDQDRQHERAGPDADGSAPGSRHNREPMPETEAGTVAVLAVAAGDGLAAALRSMGATGIVPGGQSMNPSIEELLRAVEDSPAADVILLPNNPNILLAANQVPTISGKRVRVVPARSIPQGLAALAALNPGLDLDANATEMANAVSSVRTVEVTYADKDASVDGLVVVKGQLIGLLDDRLVAAGDDETTVTCDALCRADAGAAELITIFTGNGQTPANATTLRRAIAARFPAPDIEVLDGGQPHYRLVIGVE